MKNGKYLLLFLLFLFSISLFSQTVDWETLENAELEKAKDFEEIEPEILTLIEWLGNHSLEHKDRIIANAYFMKWIIGSASVTISMDAYVLDYTKKNKDFLVLFMAGWSKYILENSDKKEDAFGGSLAGINYFLDFYEKGKDFGVKKDRKVNKLLKKRATGKLEEFITEKSN